MGPTRTTYATKDDVKIQMPEIRAEGISLEDNIYPELQTIKIWMAGFDLKEDSTAGRVYYIGVKREAGEAIKTALMEVRQLCLVRN